MRHHYIPQFYMKKWTNDKNKFICWTYKNGKLCSDLYSTKQIGYAPDLYAKNSPKDIDKHSIERGILKEIEDQASKVLKKLINEGIDSLKTQEKIYWCQFISSLTVRHVNRVNHAHKISKHIFRRENFVVNTIAEMCDLQSKRTKYSSNFKECLMKMNWWLMDFSETGLDLITSDNPITLDIPEDKKFRSITEALDSGYGILIFPLSPTICFFASKNINSLYCDKSNLIELINYRTVSRAEHFLCTKTMIQKQFIEKHFNTSNASELLS